MSIRLVACWGLTAAGSHTKDLEGVGLLQINTREFWMSSVRSGSKLTDEIRVLLLRGNSCVG